MANVPCYNSESDVYGVYNAASPREKRAIENFVLAKPLSDINSPDHLHFLAALIQDHDHFAERLQTEPDKHRRYLKYEAIKPYLKFKANAFSWYNLPPSERGHIWIPQY